MPNLNYIKKRWAEVRGQFKRGEKYMCPLCRRIVNRDEIIIGTHTDPVTHETHGVGCVYCQALEKQLTPEELAMIDSSIQSSLEKIL